MVCLLSRVIFAGSNLKAHGEDHLVKPLPYAPNRSRPSLNEQHLKLLM